LSPDRAASVRARLLMLAKSRGEDFNLILNRYATERWLYRLSISEDRDQLWLKGAMLFDLWMRVPHRPTRDADFLGFGPIDPAALERLVLRVSAVASEDGMEFERGSLSIEEIREEARYGGLRARIVGGLGRARCSLQLDFGYGDAVTPGPEDIELPTLLEDLPAPRLKGYPRATVAAEKLEAIAHLGMANTRMKDYFDLYALAREGAIDPDELGRAIMATFERRRTPLPDDVPVGLTSAFALDESRQRLWRAFLGRNRLSAPQLNDVVEALANFVRAPFSRARSRPG
jgi:hypothetical protein